MVHAIAEGSGERDQGSAIVEIEGFREGRVHRWKMLFNVAGKVAHIERVDAIRQAVQDTLFSKRELQLRGRRCQLRKRLLVRWRQCKDRSKMIGAKSNLGRYARMLHFFEDSCSRIPVNKFAVATCKWQTSNWSKNLRLDWPVPVIQSTKPICL